MSSTKKVRIEFNSLDYPVSYACQDLLDAQTNSTLSNIKVEFLYDLAFPSSLDENAAREEIEGNLLKQLALSYGLWNGAACNDSPTTGLWLIKATSKPTDTPNPLFDSCYKLAANSTESCVSYNGFMSVSAIGPEDMPEIIEQISAAMSSGAVTADTEMRVSFLGTQIETESYNGGRDNLAPAINAQLTNDTGGDKTWTPLGVLLLVGICMAFIGLVLVVRIGLRRRRRGTDEVEEDDLDEDEEEEVYRENSGGEPELKPKQIAL